MNGLFTKKTVVLIQILLFISLCLNAKDASFYASNSVLSSGDWYKIAVPTNGVYKLSYDDLVKMGISDPAHVQIRGYGGWMLDEDFSTTYYDDLPEIAVWMNKGADGIFNQGDYLLFYGRGSIQWTRTAKEFVQTNNPYSNAGYYFITQGQAEPLQMNSIVSVSDPTATDITSYTDYMIHEKDSVNLLQSGREFYGESFFSTPSKNISFNIPGILSWSGYTYSFIAKPSSAVNLSFSLNNTLLYTRTISANTNAYSYASIVNQYLDGIATTNENSTFNLTLNKASVPNSFLNFIRVYFKRKLQPYGTVTFFRNDVDNVVHQYKVSNANQNSIVLNVTNSLQPSIQETSFTSGELKFTAESSSQQEYALVDLSGNIPQPTIIGKISSQNLHALHASDMIVIAPQVYKSYAQKLADLHYQKDGLTTLIVDPEQIYNEFSSGTPDASAYRRFLKMFYDRGTSDSDRPKYLLFFGSATYNNKFINSNISESERKNYLLTYQSINSLSLTSSYTTDDYFGFLKDEGPLTMSSAKLNIGIGRLPARSVDDAQVYLNKISQYMSDTTRGIWKNNICFLADDAVGSSGYIPLTEMNHEKQSDKYAETVQNKYPNFISNKIYEDSYKRIQQSNGYRYPDAYKTLMNKLNEGQLILNYVGHGSNRDWSHEYIMTLKDIQSLTNKHLPLWITATCDFSCFDSDNVSGGESALNNPKGGAIALLSTVRLVYITNNDSMGTNTYKNILERENGKALRLGDVIKRTKLSFTVNDENKVKYQLLGDPALRLSYPDDTYKVIVTSINNATVSPADTVTLSPLSNVKITGQIVDSNNNIVNDFNGKVSSLIFDSQQDVTTYDNGGDGSYFKYKNYLNSLYSGTINVQNGSFNIEFVVPKDAFYTSNHGKMNFYAWANDERNAQGYFLNYRVGGATGNVTDYNPPIMNGLSVDPSTLKLHFELSDDSGINLSSGLGHAMNIVVDGKYQYDIASNFVSYDSSTKNGFVDYSLQSLSPGSHSIKVMAWDVCNNFVEKTIDFVVDEPNKTYLSNFSLEKTTVTDNVRFQFSANTQSSNIAVEYEVYSASTGELVWTHQQNGTSENMNNYIYKWDLKTSRGKRVSAGAYNCKATISINGAQQSTKTVKLIVAAQ